MFRRRSAGGPAMTAGAPAGRRRTTINPTIIGRSSAGRRLGIVRPSTGLPWMTIFIGVSIPGGILFPRRCTYCCLSFGLLLPLFTTHCSYYIQYGIIPNICIHLNVCVPSVSSSARTGLLYCGGAHKNIISSSDDRGIGVRWPDADRTDICRSSSDYSSFIHTARSLCDQRGIIPRWPNGDRPIYGIIFPRNFGRWSTGHRQMFRRRPDGRRRMA